MTSDASSLVRAQSWDELDQGFRGCVENIKENVILAGLWILKMRETDAWREHWDTLEDYFTGPVDAGGCGFGSYQTPTRWARVAQRYIVDLGCSVEQVGQAEHTKLDLLAGRASPENLSEVLKDSHPVALGGLSLQALKQKWLDRNMTPVSDGCLQRPMRIWPFNGAPQKFRDRLTEKTDKDFSGTYLGFVPFESPKLDSITVAGVKMYPVGRMEATEGNVIVFEPHRTGT